jgi:membrane protease YdiL (CAAX protease family)
MTGKTLTLRLKHWCIAEGMILVAILVGNLFGFLDQQFLPGNWRIDVTYEAATDLEPAVLRQRVTGAIPPDLVVHDYADDAVSATERPMGNGCGPDARRVSVTVAVDGRRLGDAMQRVREAVAAGARRTCDFGYRTPSGDAAGGSLIGNALAALLILAALWHRRHAERPWAWLNWSPLVGGRQAAVAGAGTAVAMMALILGYAWLLSAVGAATPPPPTGSSPSWLIVVMAVLIAPIVEEFVFRAWFISHARIAVGPVLATLASVAMFVIVHAPTGAAALGSLLIGGLLLSILWLRTQSLLACVIAHAGWNALVVLAQSLQEGL